MAITIKVKILDEENIQEVEITETFKTDKASIDYLKEVYRTKMQNIFDRLGAGEFKPSQIMYNSSSVESVQTAVISGINVNKKKLYDIAAKACYERTEILIFNS